MWDTTVTEEVFSLADCCTQIKGKGNEGTLHDAGGLNRDSRISKKFQTQHL